MQQTNRYIRWIKFSLLLYSKFIRFGVKEFMNYIPSVELNEPLATFFFANLVEIQAIFKFSLKDLEI